MKFHQWLHFVTFLLTSRFPQVFDTDPLSVSSVLRKRLSGDDDLTLSKEERFKIRVFLEACSADDDDV